MSYRKLEVNGTIYEFTIGKSFVKIRGNRKPIPLSECGYKIGNDDTLDPRYMVTPKTIKEFILNGKVKQIDQICEKHNKPKFWSADPYATEIYDNYTPYFACEDCFDESALDI